MIKPAPDSDVRKDLDIESLTDSCDQPRFSTTEKLSGWEGGEEKVEEEEEEGNMAERDSVTETRTARSSLGSTESQRQSVSSGSQHEYIASDSIMLCSYPPSMTGNIGSGGGWQRHHSTVAEMTPQEDRETETTTDTITLGERSENGATDCKSTGRGFGITATAAGTDAESLGVFGDLTAGFRNLLSEVADLAVGDSGIDVQNET